MAFAAVRPAPIARITVAAPVTASPPAKTPSRDVASYPKGLKVKSFTLRYDASTDIFSVTLEIGDRSRQTLSQTSFEVKRINRTVT